MKRREFLKGAAVAGGAAAALTLAAPAIAQGRQQWIVASSFGKAGILGRHLDAFGDFVKIGRASCRERV